MAPVVSKTRGPFVKGRSWSLASRLMLRLMLRLRLRLRLMLMLRLGLMLRLTLIVLLLLRLPLIIYHAYRACRSCHAYPLSITAHRLSPTAYPPYRLPLTAYPLSLTAYRLHSG